MTDCDHVRHELGVYALGALTEDEEAPVREHLARCQSCRDEHARLAALRPLLDLAEPGADPPAHEPPPPLLEDAVLAGFAAERREAPAKRTEPSRRARRPRRLPPLRVALPSAALGAVLAVAALAALGGLESDHPARATTAVELRGGAGSAHAVIAPHEAGTTIELDARLPPTGRREHYDVYMLAGGYEISAGSFRVDGDGRVQVDLACGGPPEAYDTIVIRRGERTVLEAGLPA
ncbi:MAG TPA: zf-HC2 domain-containing protein [Solirubrobacteraceae bacterium]|nr:zf-HC2 domain-containing protein [Solirubrobacteraceae bacterium]